MEPAVIKNLRPDLIVIHHTATENSVDLSEYRALDLSRRIQSFHMEKRGWADTGQQFTISRGGYVMEGRNRTLGALRARRHVIGAHTAGHNDHSVGIECEGTYVDTLPTTPLWRSLVRLCAHLCNMYRLNPYEAIVGHRNLNATACPGDIFYSLLPHLRREVALKFIVPLSPLMRMSAALPDLGTNALPPRHDFDHGPTQALASRRR
ncbi:peptidoglycan recognition protein family protein [Thermomonospora umbrina]|uniref:peptidoglycan recognition protein family protein n=1 Tax=Thermomonospora umbrina TaxID=111806 RepID=UPI001FEB2273|nr:peptidoglycan recognition family protein [Thermomonospora umbrina]